MLTEGFQFSFSNLNDEYCLGEIQDKKFEKEKSESGCVVRSLESAREHLTANASYPLPLCI